jgi:hypothetical protein
MPKPRSEKKRQSEHPGEQRVQPMQLQSATASWTRPASTQGSADPTRRRLARTRACASGASTTPTSR